MESLKSPHPTEKSETRRILWYKWDEPDIPQEEKETLSNLSFSPQQNSFLMGPTHIILTMKDFKLWVGHTNFYVTPSILEAIKSVPGVESLCVWTPYRFRLGVGYLFSDKKVKSQVEQVLCGKKELPVEVGPYSRLKTILREKFPYWAIAVQQSNGNVYSFGGPTRDEVVTQLAPLKGYDFILSWE